MAPTKARFIECDGLDPKAPYSLGNKRYYYERKCNSGHENLADNEIGFTGGYYDGYDWTVPICLRCVTDGRLVLHSHNTPVHLVEIDIDILYREWRQQLIETTLMELIAAGYPSNPIFRINDIEARKCFDSGMTPLQTFRETYER